MKRTKLILVSLLLALTLTGCAEQQVSPISQPSVVVQQTEAQLWAKAVDYFSQIETARHAANQIALSLSKQNPPLVPVAVLSSFVKVDQYAIAANKLLQSSPNTFGQPLAQQVLALASSILTELNQWNSMLVSQPTLAAPVKQIETAASGVGGLK